MGYSIKQLIPRKGDRVALLGLSGSGKTYLSEWLLGDGTQPTIVFDPKREYPREGFTVLSRPCEIDWHFKKKPVLIVPDEKNFDDPAFYDEFFQKLYKRGNVRIYIDEVAMFTSSTSWPHFLKVLLAQGRSRRITTICGTQRPSGVPQFIFSEASEFFAFKLNLPTDIKKVSSFVKGYDSELLDEFEFFWYRIDFKGPAIKMILPAPEPLRLAS